MHPFLAGRRLLGYFAAWLIFGLLFAGGILAAGVMPAARSLLLCLPLALVLGALGLSCWYLVRTLPLSGTAASRLAGTWVGAGGVLMLLWVSFALGWLALLRAAGLSPAENSNLLLPVLLFAGGIGLAVTVLGMYALEALQRSHETERRALELHALAREVETTFLRRQLDPHFLFNSLNSIAALIGTDSAAARRMCFLLAEFFRGSLKLGAQQSITVAQELGLVEAFLAIEHVRFGARLRARIEVADETQQLAVPALLLQPLVENAVHHGVAHLVAGGDIVISAQRRDELLELTVDNACDPERPASHGTGLGLANVKGRIDALFGRQAQMQVHSTPERFRVLILLPTGTAQARTHNTES